MKSEEKKRMIDLTKVKWPHIDGTEEIIDMSKDVASVTYNRTQNLEIVSACIDLFKTGQCEYSDVMKEELTQTINNLERVVDGGKMPLGIIYKKALLEALER